MQISVCLFGCLCVRVCVCASKFQFKRCGVCRLSAFPSLGGAIHLNFPWPAPLLAPLPLICTCLGVCVGINYAGVSWQTSLQPPDTAGYAGFPGPACACFHADIHTPRHAPLLRLCACAVLICCTASRVALILCCCCTENCHAPWINVAWAASNWCCCFDLQIRVLSLS